MVHKLITIVNLVAMATGAVIPVHLSHTPAHVYLKDPINSELNSEAQAHYEFEYSVNDPQSGDIKQQKETRNGDSVKGFYSFLQADGAQRIVEYTSSKDDGFQAVVRYESQAKKPVAATVPKDVAPVKYVSALSTPVLYAPTSAKLTYAPALEGHEQLYYTQTPHATYGHAQNPYVTAQDPHVTAQDPTQVNFVPESEDQATQVGYSLDSSVIYTLVPRAPNRQSPQISYGQNPQVAYQPVNFAQPTSRVIFIRVPYDNHSSSYPSQVAYAQVPSSHQSGHVHVPFYPAENQYGKLIRSRSLAKKNVK